LAWALWHALMSEFLLLL